MTSSGFSRSTPLASSASSPTVWATAAPPRMCWPTPSSGCSGRRRGSEKPWLYTIPLNLVRARARRSEAEQRAYERVQAAPARQDELEALSGRDELQRALGELSEE